MFKVNEGPMDRLARAIVGVVLLFLALSQTGGLQILLFVLAVICLLTAITGFCGIYTLLKINTTKKTLTPSEPKDLPSEAPAKMEETAEPIEDVKEEEEEEEEEKVANIMSEPESTPAEEIIETPALNENEPEDLSSGIRQPAEQEEEKPILL